MLSVSRSLSHTHHTHTHLTHTHIKVHYTPDYKTCAICDFFVFFCQMMRPGPRATLGMRMSSILHTLSRQRCVAVCGAVLQCEAVYCSVLQCIAVCCSLLGMRMSSICHTESGQQCVAVCGVCCSVLQCVAVCCSVLQSTTGYADELDMPHSEKTTVCCSVWCCVAACSSV